MENDIGNSTPVFNPILRTKLHRPQLTAELVNRERLIKAMNRAHEVPLTLVAAPAGYGKSVLVAQWAEQLDSPVAWLSLDASDSELRAFLLYFVAAVDAVSPGACEATSELRGAGSLVPVPILAAYLLNDLDAIDVPAAIVLDDYHRIDTLSPVQDLMLCRSPVPVLSTAETQELREQADGMTRHLESLDLARERAVVVREEYMSLLAQKQNERVYILTLVAAVFLPLTFVAGLLGMNVAGLPGTEHPAAFMISMALMAGLGVGLVAFFKWKRWM